MTNDSIKFCPTCASSSLRFSELVGGDADCLACGWVGKTTDLLLVPIQHDFAFGKESIIAEMMNGLRQILAGELGLPYLKFLLKWGFLEGDLKDPAHTIDRKKFARYMAAIGHAILTAVIAERAKQSELKARKGKEDLDASRN